MEPSDQNGDSDHDALARATNDVDAAERDDTVSAGETVLHSTEIAVVDDQVFTQVPAAVQSAVVDAHAMAGVGQDGGADDDQNDDLDLTNLAGTTFPVVARSSYRRGTSPVRALSE